MMNHRLTFAAGVATAAASLSLYAVLYGNAWMVAGIGAIVAVALAGTLTRLATVPAAIAAAIAVLIASVPLLAGHGWPGLAGGLVLVAIAALSATGTRLPRAFAALATYCSCLLIYLNLVFARAQSIIWLIPTASSASALTRLPSQASQQYHYAPPIHATRPIDFIAAGGIGAVAIIVDIVAVRLRRPALAGLPLLLLFSVPVATNLKGFGLDQSLTFGVSLAAYLALLSTDGRQRLRMWGRLVTVRRMTAEEAGPGPDTKDLAATGRRIGLAAVCLAIVVPLALPTGKPHDIFGKTNDGNLGVGVGSGSSTRLSPLLTIGKELDRATPVPVLSYTTNSADPRYQYLQEYVLNYDTARNTWLEVTGPATSLVGDRLPYEIPGLDSGIPFSTVTTKVTEVGQPDNPLPLPYAPVRLSVGGGGVLTEASGSLMVFDAQQLEHVHLTVTSHEPDPSAADLSVEGQIIPNVIMNGYGSYKGPDAAKLLKIAEDHVAGATTPLQQARDLQDWLTSSAFTYTLKPNLPNSPHWLVKFLTTDRRGECQQYSWAFAVLARLLGLPTRIAVGYTGGTQTAGGVWQVTTADAHAWPELYFPTVGWVRFEPTPTGSDGQGTAYAPLYTKGSQASQPGAPTGLGKTSSGSAAKGHGGTLNEAKIHGLGGAGATAARSGARSSHGFPPAATIAIVVVLLLLIWPGLGRWLTRRRRWLGASGDAAMAHAAWHELVDDLTDYGIAVRPSESPRATARRVSEVAGLPPATREVITRVGAAEERARYSPGTLPGAGLRADVHVIRRALAARATRGQRLRAVFAPASTLATATRGLQSLSRATSWIDSSWPTMRRQIRRTMAHRTS
jgi:TgpA N-terminal domain/Transglutaminase-like superfamily/Domain of unknown function (DUF4129)